MILLEKLFAFIAKKAAEKFYGHITIEFVNGEIKFIDINDRRIEL
jgi:hypothetical protein